MKVSIHDHQGGLAALPGTLRQEIENAVAACAIVPARGTASSIGDAIMAALNKEGWSGAVALAGRASKISITSMKKEAGLCMQTGGNMSRMYADLLKLQHMFLSNTINVGAMITPSHVAAKKLGDNLVNADRLGRELDIFRKVIHMPLVVFAFD